MVYAIQIILFLSSTRAPYRLLFRFTLSQCWSRIPYRSFVRRRRFPYLMNPVARALLSFIHSMPFLLGSAHGGPLSRPLELPPWPNLRAGRGPRSTLSSLLVSQLK